MQISLDNNLFASLGYLFFSLCIIRPYWADVSFERTSVSFPALFTSCKQRRCIMSAYHGFLHLN